jgi:uncharacterized protein YjbI with pentapeptide repeats
LPRLRQLIRLPVPDPRDGRGAAAAVFYEMVEEVISGDGAPDTKEAEALAAALNHSAERVQTLWFSFLTFMLYLAIATGTTTHRMLFLEEPLNLPVLNIKLPLLGFYFLTPIIFVVFHFYMLLNLVLLARTAKSFEDSLARAFHEDREPRENFRMRIENTLFVQLLVGGRLEREGINAKFLSLMALITLALAPVALLLMFEVYFLPYHNERITWLHRGLLALDLALVWTLWPGYRSGWGVRLWPKAAWWLVVPGIGSAAALIYAVLVATFPDERMYLGTNWLRESWAGAKIAPVNTLALRGEDLIDDAKLAHIIENGEIPTGAQRWVATLTLAGRDLTGADLGEADVRDVDFWNAILNRANLDDVWAEKAHFEHAQLQGASLQRAQLQGASLDGAQLQGASLFLTQLQGASLDGAQLQGAWLSHTQFQGASLGHTQLQGALLDLVQLQGTSLDGAQLQGASLVWAHLEGASLDGAQLQGASLDAANLQGASLDFAQLQGASLDGAQLHGASLQNADLQGASFADVCAWRADASRAEWKDTRVVHPETDPKADRCDRMAASFANLKQLIAEKVPDGENKRAAMKRIEQRLDPERPLEGEKDIAKFWAARESEAATPEAHEKYEKSLAGIWRKTGCAAEGAPGVLHALIARLSSPGMPFRDQSDAAKSLAAAFLDDGALPRSAWALRDRKGETQNNHRRTGRTACAPISHGLSEADRARLKKIAAPAAPQAPKP